MQREIVINRGDLHMIVHFDQLYQMDIAKYRKFLRLLFQVNSERNRTSGEQIKAWFTEKLSTETKYYKQWKKRADLFDEYERK